MAIEAAKLSIRVEADTGQLVRGALIGERAMDSLERKARSSVRGIGSAFRDLTAGRIGLSQFAGEARKAGNDLATSFRGINTSTKLLAGAAAGIGLIGVAIAKSIGPAIEFESAFAGVRKTVDGTEVELARIRDGLLDMSKVMPTAADELASIAENAGQLGVAAPDVLKFTETIAMLGETTDLDFDEAAQSLARFLNITGDGARSIDQTADVIVELGNNSATTESQIVSMATRLASAFTAAGANQQEILGIAAALSSVGIEAEAGGTAASTAITKLTDAAKDGGDALRLFSQVAGVLPEDFQRIANESPVEALVLFTEGLGKMSAAGQSITPVLGELELSGIRVRRALESMGLSSDLVRRSLGLAESQFKNGGAAALEYSKRVETTASRLEILRNRLNTIAVEVGTPFLDAVVATVDGLGDGIEELIDIARPLGRELSEVFVNAAEAAELFFDVIGAPTLKVFAAALNGTLQIGAGVLSMFNELGAAGPLLLTVGAAIALWPGGFVAARTAAAGLALSVQLVGTRATAATVAMQGLQKAASAGPLIVLTAALAAVGKALHDAKVDAEATGDAFRDQFSTAIESADFDSFNTALDRLRERQDELRESSLASGSAWDQFKAGFSKGFGGNQVEGFQQIADTRAELEELQGVLSDLERDQLYVTGLGRLASAFSLTRQEVAAMVDQQGIHTDVVAIGTGKLTEFEIANSAAGQAIGAQADELGGLAAAMETSIDRILAGEAGMQDWTDALGFGADAIQFLVDQAEGFDMADLFDPDKAGLLYDELVRLDAKFKGVAAQIGVTTGQIYEQNTALGRMAAAHDDVRKAIDGTRTALESMEAQQLLAEEAAESYEEALGSIGETGGLENAARAMRNLSLETAGTGISAREAVDNQRELYDQFLRTAAAAGIEEEEARKVAAALGLIPEEALATITVEGAEAEREAAERQRQLNELAGVYDAELTVTDYAGLIIQRVQGQAFRFPNRYEAELAVQDNAAGTLARRNQDADYFERPRRTEVSVIDRASGPLALIRSYLDRIPGQKSITLTTITRTSRSGTVRFQADGGIQRFNNGGFKIERPGTANIYQPASTYRVFAEPETGGEAYIPLARAKRARSMQILRETARLMDAQVVPLEDGGIQRAMQLWGRPSIRRFADGGITPGGVRSDPGPVVLNAPIQIDISGSTVADSERLASLVETRVQTALRQAGRELVNMRR